MNIVSWLTKRGFDQDGDTWSKVLEGEDLKRYFGADADTTRDIESGEVQAAYLEINPEEETVQYILFEGYPSSEDIANANIVHDDDYVGVMDWLRPTIKELREQSRMIQKDFADYFNIPVRTLQDWEQNRRTPPPYVVEMIEERIKKLSRKMEVRMGIYTSLTGSRYDVHDFLEILENLLGELPVVGNERLFYSTVQKLAQSKGYSIAWISKSLTNDVILDTLVDKPHYAVVGFGVEKNENKDKLMAELKHTKSELEKATDEDMQESIFKHYKEKAQRYKL